MIGERLAFLYGSFSVSVRDPHKSGLVIIAVLFCDVQLFHARSIVRVSILAAYACLRRQIFSWKIGKRCSGRQSGTLLKDARFLGHRNCIATPRPGDILHFRLKSFQISQFDVSTSEMETSSVTVNAECGNIVYGGITGSPESRNTHVNRLCLATVKKRIR